MLVLSFCPGDCALKGMDFFAEHLFLVFELLILLGFFGKLVVFRDVDVLFDGFSDFLFKFFVELIILDFEVGELFLEIHIFLVVFLFLLFR